MTKTKSKEMIIYPAIDLLAGQCVRLKQGRYDDVTVYSDDPLALARQFKEDGAAWLHVIDLEGARSGQPVQAELVRAIKQETGLKVQTGGGIRSMADLKLLLDEYGLDRAILGTAAVKDKAFVNQALASYGERIAIGIDARDGNVCVEGWTAASGLNYLDFARLMAQAGARCIIFTDISRDGMLSGPAVRQTKELLDLELFSVIASGGISSQADIAAVRDCGADGLIIGKAIYEGKVVLSQCW